jgi:hypothetical protein
MILTQEEEETCGLNPNPKSDADLINTNVNDDFYFCVFIFVGQVRVSAVLTNAPFLLNLDCDHYINNSKAIREAMCFMMDPLVGKRVCYVQFPQRFDGIDRNDRYANHNTVFFDVRRRITHFFLSPSFICLIDMIHQSLNPKPQNPETQYCVFF